MAGNDFWQVELMAGMGPLLLGSELMAIQKVLVDRGIDTDPRFPGHAVHWSCPLIRTRLTFSESSPRILTHIEVDDERLRFATLPVIGKRAYEIIGIFNVSRKETLWTRDDLTPDQRAEPVRGNMSPELNRELLARGTLWIKRFGLGMTLREGLVATVHLCDPKDVPRDGVGQWTKEQQRLSEVRETGSQSTRKQQSLSEVRERDGQTREPVRFPLKPARALLHFAFVCAAGMLVWWAISLQRKWDAVAEVPAVVVELEPPPPHPLPDNVTVQFPDSGGVQRRTTLGSGHFEMAPKMGDQINVRFLPGKPDHVLGPIAARDIGFTSAVPCGFGILLAYTILLLVLGGKVRTNPRRPGRIEG